MSKERKSHRFAQPTGVTTAVARMLTEDGQNTNQRHGTLGHVTLARVELDPMNPRHLGLDPTNPAQIAQDDPERERKERELAELYILAESIKEQGILQEPGVYEHGASYRLVWGERRVLACRLLGMETIPAKILPERPRSLRAKQLIENMQRRDLSLYGRLEGMRALLAEDGEANGEESHAATLQRTLGIQKTMAYEYASVLDAPADVLEAIRNESVNSLRMAIRIAAVSDPDERAILMAGGEPGQTAEQDTPEQAPTSKRPRIGRPCKSVVFRTTSTNVARHIAERILSAADFKQYASQNWSDIGIATDLLKQIIARLEKQLSGE